MSWIDVGRVFGREVGRMVGLMGILDELVVSISEGEGLLMELFKLGLEIVNGRLIIVCLRFIGPFGLILNMYCCCF